MLTTEEIDDFYRRNLSDHGASAVGMGWRDQHAQQIRFQQLLKIVRGGELFSINDLGCGSGDLVKVLQSQFNGQFRYHGYDALKEMIVAAKIQFSESATVRFSDLSDYQQMEISDYSVASGIFNVRNSTLDSDWLSYILTTLHAMSDHSSKGFAFNALTSYSDPERMRPDLYYSNPLFFFEYCKKNFSRNVALLHDYGIYDFTILVRKDV